MKLIREEVETIEVLTEEKNGKKHFYIQGPFLQGDIKNRNGRIYESNILAKEVDRYNNQYISKNRAMGELGHPDGPTVNLDRVSHKITSLKQEGSNFIGKTLQATELSEQDINVLTLYRGNKVIPNPKMSRTLEPDDKLLCFGKMETMRGMVPVRTRRRRRPKIKDLAPKTSS